MIISASSSYRISVRLYGGRSSLALCGSITQVITVSCVQTWYYFLKYRQDVWYIKVLVSNYTETHDIEESYIYLRSALSLLLIPSIRFLSLIQVSLNDSINLHRLFH